MKISTLISDVVSSQQFNAVNYPRLARIPPHQHQEFALRQLGILLQIAGGKLAEVVEPMQSGTSLDKAKLRLATREFLVHTFRLVDAAGMTPAEAVEEINSWIADNRKNKREQI